MTQTALSPFGELENPSEFIARHIGVSAADEAVMLKAVGATTRRELIETIVPRSIARSRAMDIPAPITEVAALAELKAMAAKNKVFKSYIGQGYYDTHTPGVILRNILENPAWYTAYTPYQAEISQGRMEALVNFQTMIMDLTAMPMANASMLDEATAAAEAMTLALRAGKSKSTTFLVDSEVLPQTLAVIQTRARPLGITVKVCKGAQALAQDSFAALLQYPGVSGVVRDERSWIASYKAKGGIVIMAADLLALTLLTPPGELGADIAIGTTQRFGTPMGNGGPHAAYMACRDEFKRAMPGRVVGVSIDVHGNPAYRLALQTREQHIRREKATSNICTAQVLPAVVASMYAIYHGPQGLTRIARRVHGFAAALSEGLRRLGYTIVHEDYFDTIRVALGKRNVHAILDEARSRRINLRVMDDRSIVVALDETVSNDDITNLLAAFNGGKAPDFGIEDLASGADPRYDERFNRTTRFLKHPVFNKH